jgi:ribulose-phosphate 3-epimerase
MIEIIPAILPKSFADLEIKLGLVREATRAVQVDVVDGVYAPSKTWPYADREAFEEIVRQERGMPFWEDIDFEFDCMIAHPQKEIEEYIAAGATRVVVHGAGQGIVEVLEKLQPSRAGDLGVKVGIALLPGDEAGVYAQYAALCNFVQVMGIVQVGFQGHSFDARAIDLITSLRELYPELTIQVDGGVTTENARALAAAGANRLVVGSAIFGSDDPAQAIAALSREANRK